MWRPRLLVVDDDDDVAAIVCRVAEHVGFKTKKISGARAFSACAAFEPDVIVLDIFMPEIDGFEVLRYLGQAQRRSSIVIASGKGAPFRDMAARMCEQAGLPIIGNIAKPFTVDVLKQVLGEAKKRHPIHLQGALPKTPSLQDSA